MKPGTLRRNLTKLALYLATKRESKVFSMTSYARTRSGKELEPKECEAHTCGTVCCAVGSGIRAGIPAGKCSTWGEYCDKFVDTDEAYTWLFDYNWVTYDNTPKGAAYRIGYFLKEGIPDWFLFPYEAHRNLSRYEECLKIGKKYIDSLK
jgi:hypothetical protein